MRATDVLPIRRLFPPGGRHVVGVALKGAQQPPEAVDRIFGREDAIIRFLPKPHSVAQGPLLGWSNAVPRGLAHATERAIVYLICRS
jgi:hypothetical protein